MSAWVNLPTPSNNQKIFSNMDAANKLGYNLGVGSAGAVLYPEVYDSSTALTNFTSGAIPSNTWTHLVFTWTTGGQLVGYINGVQVNGVAATANPVGAEANFQGTIGTSAWNTGAFPATGTLDEVRVSNIARSANWIATEYNNQSNTAVGAGTSSRASGQRPPHTPRGGIQAGTTRRL